MFNGVRYHLSPSLSPTLTNDLTEGLNLNGATQEEELRTEGLTHVITETIQGYKDIIHTSVAVVTPKWFERSMVLGKMQPTEYYSPDPALIFSGVSACASGLPTSDLETLTAGITSLGGMFRTGLTRDVTHLFILQPHGEKYDTAMHFKTTDPNHNLVILLPHWFDDALRIGTGALPTLPYEWPDPRVLKGYPDDDTEWEKIKKERQTDTKDKRARLSALLGASNPTLETDNEMQNDIWRSRRILLSRNLRLVAGRREAIVAGVMRAGGLVVGPAVYEEYDEEDEAEYDDETEELEYVEGCDVYITRYRGGPAYNMALRHEKIIGALGWLFLVQSAGSMTRPEEQLLHYPLPRTPIKNFERHEITVTNYTGPAREYLKKIIEAMGAKFTPSMSSRNTALVAAFVGGTKTEKAINWSIPVVNHTWLEDCFVQWQSLTPAQSKYIDFPPGVDFARMLGESTRGIDMAREMESAGVQNDNAVEVEEQPQADINMDDEEDMDGEEEEEEKELVRPPPGTENSARDAREVEQIMDSGPADDDEDGDDNMVDPPNPQNDMDVDEHTPQPKRKSTTRSPAKKPTRDDESDDEPQPQPPRASGSKSKPRPKPKPLAKHNDSQVPSVKPTRANALVPSPPKSTSKIFAKAAQPITSDDDEAVYEKPPPRKPLPPKRTTTSTAVDDDQMDVDIPDQESALTPLLSSPAKSSPSKLKTYGKSSLKKRVVTVARPLSEEDSEPQVDKVPSGKKVNGKRNAVAAKSKSKPTKAANLDYSATEDDEADDAPIVSSKSKANAKGKAKPKPKVPPVQERSGTEDEDDDDEPPPATKFKFKPSAAASKRRNEEQVEVKEPEQTSTAKNKNKKNAQSKPAVDETALSAEEEEVQEPERRRVKPVAGRKSRNSPSENESDAPVVQPKPSANGSKKSKGSPLKRVVSVVITERSPKNASTKGKAAATAGTSVSARTNGQSSKPIRTESVRVQAAEASTSKRTVALKRDISVISVNDDDDKMSVLSALTRLPSQRSAATKASQKLREEIMPDVLSYENQSRKDAKARKSGDFSLTSYESSKGKNKRREEVGGDEERERKKRRVSKAHDEEPSEGETGDEGAVIVVSKGKKKAATPSDDEGEEEIAPSKKKNAIEPATEKKATATTSAKPDVKVIRIMTTQVSLSDDVVKALLKLGIKTTIRPNECTHLVAAHLVRTEKFLCAMAVCPFVVTDKWALACAKAKKILPEDKYLLNDPPNEKKYKMKLADSLERSKVNEGKLLGKQSFYVTQGVGKHIDLKLLKNVITSNGGIYKSQQPTMRIMSGGDDRHVISCEEDVAIWRDLAANYPVYTQELVLIGVLKQQIDWDSEDYRVPGSLGS